MGVLNITPDSFSDGGLFAEPETAVAHGLRLLAAGADLLDLGAESTRPGGGVSATVPNRAGQEELRRLLPVIEALRAGDRRAAHGGHLQGPRSPRPALAAGADRSTTSAGGRDPACWPRRRDARAAAVVLMHMPRRPAHHAGRPALRRRWSPR